MKSTVLAALIVFSSFAGGGCGGLVGGDTGSAQDNSGGDREVRSVIPLGTYARCEGASALHHEVGAIDYYQVGGGEGSLTLEQNAGVLKATLGGTDLRAKGTFDFTTTTPTTAITTSGSLSVTALTDPPSTSPITVDVTVGAGALTFEGQTLFLSIDGGPQARYFFACDAPSSAPSSASSSSTTHDALETGDFGDCSSCALGGVTGGTGSVTLTRTDATVTATMTGLAATNGALDFVTTSDGSVRLVEGQTPLVDEMSCTEPLAGGLTPLLHATGVLVVQGDTLFIDLTGATSCKAQYPTLITCRRAV